MAQIEKVYKHIDDNIDGHIESLRRLLMQPSVSQTGEGMAECAGMLKGWLGDLGCSRVELAEPEFHWPIAYGEYDAGAEKTIIAYGMYDVQPVEPDQWKVPPFEGRIVEMPPFERVVREGERTSLHVIYIDYLARVTGGTLKPGGDVGEAVWVDKKELPGMLEEIHEDTRKLLEIAKIL